MSSGQNKPQATGDRGRRGPGALLRPKVESPGPGRLVPAVWQEYSWQPRIRVSHTGKCSHAARLLGARLCEPQRVGAARGAKELRRVLPGEGAAGRRPAVQSGARLCEPQRVGRRRDVDRLRRRPGLPGCPMCCGSQTRAALLVAMPRRVLCGPRRRDTTWTHPFDRL
jgi:hypothetical protein